MFPTELLLNYGGLGLFTLYLVWDKQVAQKKMVTALENNTAALNRIEKKIK